MLIRRCEVRLSGKNPREVSAPITELRAKDALAGVTDSPLGVFGSAKGERSRPLEDGKVGKERHGDARSF